MVVINDGEENQFLVNELRAAELKGKRFWIGLKKEKREIIIQWVDGSKLVYQYWDTKNGNPSGVGNISLTILSFFVSINI